MVIFYQVLFGENEIQILDGSFSSWLVYSNNNISQGRLNFLAIWFYIYFIFHLYFREVCFSPKNHWIGRNLFTWTNFSFFNFHFIHCCWGWQTGQVPQSSSCRVYVNYEKFFKHGVYISVLVSICNRNSYFSHILHFLYLQEFSE